jgi:polysaccharide export outer membrane protein
MALLIQCPAQAQDAAQPQAANRDRPQSEYRIAAGDELDISVWGEERMQRTVRVLSDGTFAFPLAGTITARGQTVAQVSATIRDRIANFYRAEIPDVTVGVRNAAAISFFVVGKVRTPGTYSASREVNIVQALSMAGGLAEFADVKHAVILRQTPTGQVVEPVALAKVLKGRRQLDAGALVTALPTLRSGDVLVIP